MSLARVASIVPSLITEEVYTFIFALRIVHALRGTLAGAWQKGTVNVADVLVILFAYFRARTRATAFLSRCSTLARRFGMAASFAARMAFRRARIAARRTLRSAVVIRGEADAGTLADTAVTPIFAACLSSTVKFATDNLPLILAT
jgi:hypothetical protein